MRDGIPFRCLVCGGANFRSTAESEEENYWEGDPINEYIYTSLEVRQAFAKKYELYLRLLNGRNNGHPKHLLEIGCGSGIFLETALKYGWTVCGLDISQQAVDLAQRYLPDAKLICAPLEKAELNPSTFDVIALWDVIEHVERPEELLSQIWTLLRPGGRVILETPDEGCPTRRLIRLLHHISFRKLTLLSMIYYPAHKWYFSRQAMKIILERLKFNQIHFYRERTVKELSHLKTASYGVQSAFFREMVRVFEDVMGVVPWLRNKMVVVAAKQDR